MKRRHGICIAFKRLCNKKYTPFTTSPAHVVSVEKNSNKASAIDSLRRDRINGSNIFTGMVNEEVTTGFVKLACIFF